MEYLSRNYSGTMSRENPDTKFYPVEILYRKNVEHPHKWGRGMDQILLRIARISSGSQIRIGSATHTVIIFH